MKKKHIGIIICAVLVVVSAVVILAAVLRRNSGKETGTQDVPPTVTLAPTTQPTAVPTIEPIIAPTLEPTTEPTEIPVTAEPTIVPTLEPTEIPTATPVPTATFTPTPEPSPTPTATPVPTATPTPAEPTPTPLVEYKKDGVDVPIVQTFQISDTAYIYVYENGHIGIADTATGYTAKYGTGFENPSSVDVTTVVAKVQNALEKNNVAVESQYRPTPTPTPTPFPTPNPEQPKKLASYKGDKDYGDVTVEAWDNGYLYVKGSGVLKKTASISYCPQDLIDYWAIGRTSGVEVTHIIIEEGITELKNFPYWANNSYDDRKTIEYIEFPSTLTKVRTESFNIHFTHDVTVVGYKDGQKVTYILKTDGNILSDSESLYDVMVEQLGIR